MKHITTTLIILSIMLLTSCTVEHDAELSLDNSDMSYSKTHISATISQIDENSDTSPDESSTADESSTYSESQIPDILIENSKYEQHVVYTDKLRRDGIFPYSNLIDSVEQFNEYNVNLSELYNLDEVVGDIPSYERWIRKYDKTFFENTSLLILVVESNRNTLPKIDSVYIEGDGDLAVYIDEINIEDDELQVYHIFIEIQKTEISICDEKNVNIYY